MVKETNSQDATPAVKKTVTKKVAKKVTKKAAAPRRKTAAKPSLSEIHKKVSPAERHEMIATVAYYRAEKRGFADGYQWEDWLVAEKTVDQRLRKKVIPAKTAK